MVLRQNADAEILLSTTGANARASPPRPELSPTAVDGPVVVNILLELGEGVSVCMLFVWLHLDSNSTHEG